MLCFLENLEKSRVATEYIHATPTLRPAYFHFAVYVEIRMRMLCFFEIAVYGITLTDNSYDQCRQGAFNKVFVCTLTECMLCCCFEIRFVG